MLVDVAQQVEPGQYGLLEVEGEFGHTGVGSLVVGLDFAATGDDVAECVDEGVVEVDGALADTQEEFIR